VSITNDKLKQSMIAIGVIEFYGFWLWAYMVGANDQGFDPRKIFEEKNVKLQNICAECNQQKSAINNCINCDYFLCRKNHKIAKSIFNPIGEGFTAISDNDLKAFIQDVGGIRCSSREILLDAYDRATGLTNESLYLRAIDILQFRLKLLPLSIIKTDINIKNDSITNYSKYTQHITIDNDFSIDIIENDLQRVNLYTMWLEYNNYPDNESFYHAFMLKNCLANVEKNRMGNFDYYIEVAKCIRKMPLVSYDAADHASRVIGFWLWEQKDEMKNFKSVSEAVSYLQSGKEYPKNILGLLKFNPRSMRRFNRLHQRTIECIKKGEVLSLQ